MQSTPIIDHLSNLQIRDHDDTAGLVSQLYSLRLNDIQVSVPSGTIGTTSPQRENYQMLFSLDNEMDTHMSIILRVLEDLSSQNDAVQASVIPQLLREEEWLNSTVDSVSKFGTSNDSAVQTLTAAMLERLTAFLDAVGCYLDVLRSRKARTPEATNVVDTRVNTGTLKHS
jgi:hypothetical protein